MTYTPIKRFWKLLSKYKIELRHIYFYAIVIGLVNLTLPIGIQAIINFLQIGEFTSTWLLLVAFVILGIGVTGWLQVIQLRIVENIQQDIFASSAFEFAYRIPKIRFIKLDKVHAPELVNRFFDTLTIQKGLPKILIDFSLALFQIFFGLILLTIYSSYFILLGVVLAAILFLIFRITGPKGLSTSLKESKYKYKLAHWLEEIAAMNRSFKIYDQSKFHLKKADRIVNKYLDHRQSHFNVLLSQFRLFVGFKVVVAAGLLLLGGFLVFQERMNIGQFVAAEIIIILIINSVEKVLRVFDTIYDVLTALDKIGYVTDLPLDSNNGKSILVPSTGIGIKVEEISFKFPEDKKKIIDNLSFEIAPSQKTILTGPSGTGKSLLLQIIAGIYDVNDGEIFYNGIPFTTYNRDSVNDDLGISLPINQIFEGTFKENILLGRNISDEKLTEILNIIGLHDYLLHQPQGLEGFVDSGGRRLPRSIIQKILVARMIIDDPKLILMEDPLQFIDQDEKERIIDYLMSPERDWTILVISDYPYWASKSDKILDMTEMI